MLHQLFLMLLFFTWSSLINADFQLVPSQLSGCAIGASNQVQCWGDNSNGLLIPGGPAILFYPTVISDSVLAAGVALGESHMCIVSKDESTFSCRGDNSFGQCGIGSFVQTVTNFETQTALPFPIMGISAGDDSTCAVLNTGNLNGLSSNLYCWGESALSEIIPVPLLMSTRGVVSVAVRSQKAALFATGNVETFHDNTFSQLGIGNTTTPIFNLDSLSNPPVLGLNGAKIQTATGQKHTCILSLDGRVSCAGANSRGQLGTGDFIGRGSFVYLPEDGFVVFISCGFEFTCYVLDSGVLKCFGANEFGQLGLGDRKDRNKPTAVNLQGDQALEVFLGDFHAFALMQDGSILAWGRNDFAQLGLGQEEFFGLNVTTPQTQDALTAISQDAAQFPPGLEIFIAFMAITITGLVAFFAHEYCYLITKESFTKQFRQQDRTIFNLKSEFGNKKNSKYKSAVMMLAPRSSLLDRLTSILEKWDLVADKLSMFDSVRLESFIMSDKSKTVAPPTEKERKDAIERKKKFLDDAKWVGKVYRITCLTLIIAVANYSQNRTKPSNDAGKAAAVNQNATSTAGSAKDGDRRVQSKMSSGNLKTSGTKPGSATKIKEGGAASANADFLGPPPPAETAKDQAAGVAPRLEIEEKSEDVATVGSKPSEDKKQTPEEKRMEEFKKDIETLEKITAMILRTSKQREENASKEQNVERRHQDAGEVENYITLLEDILNQDWMIVEQVPDDDKTPQQVGNKTKVENKAEEEKTNQVDKSKRMKEVFNDIKDDPKWAVVRTKGSEKNEKYLTLEKRARGVIPLFPDNDGELRKEKKKNAKDSVTLFVERTQQKLEDCLDPKKKNKSDTKIQSSEKCRDMNGKELIRTGIIIIIKITFYLNWDLGIKPVWKLIEPQLRKFKQFPFFYGMIGLFVITIFLTFFQTPADQITTVGEPGVRPAGFGVTFLPVPPQYNLQRPLQSTAVPVIYGIMHCNLFFLGLLPVPLMRGAIRDAVWFLNKYMKWNVRRYIPVDDATFVHRFFAFCLMGGIFTVGLIWLTTMGVECMLDGQAQACIAFKIPSTDPKETVLVLRIIVWSFWFPIMPLMYIVHRGPYEFIWTFVRQYYYEIVYYLHVSVALISLVLALYARLQVFWPVLFSWIPYMAYYLWEYSRHLYVFDIYPENTAILKEAKKATGGGGAPNSIRLALHNKRAFWSCMRKRVPTREKLVDRWNSSYNPGEWVYLYLPDPEYPYAPWVGHPFSIAYAPIRPPRNSFLYSKLYPDGYGGSVEEDSEEANDEQLELHIAIKGNKHLQFDNETDTWVYNKDQPRTWTDYLREAVTKALKEGAKTRSVYVLGPYGTAFKSCFDPNYGAVVVIGAGSGLTAAESILHGFNERKYRKSKSSVADLLWFVWSTGSLEDLKWCWDQIVDEITRGIEYKVIDSSLLTASSNQIDWLGVTLYVTRLESAQKLDEFRANVLSDVDFEIEQADKRLKNKIKTVKENAQVNGSSQDSIGKHIEAETKKERDRVEQKRIRKKVTMFMMNQIYSGGVADEHSHIKDLLIGVRRKIMIAKKRNHQKNSDMTVAFCGLSDIAAIVKEAANELDGDFGCKVEFSEDGQ